jgi:hypothetical protein
MRFVVCTIWTAESVKIFEDNLQGEKKFFENKIKGIPKKLTTTI